MGDHIPPGPGGPNILVTRDEVRARWIAAGVTKEQVDGLLQCGQNSHFSSQPWIDPNMAPDIRAWWQQHVIDNQHDIRVDPREAQPQEGSEGAESTSAPAVGGTSSGCVRNEDSETESERVSAEEREPSPTTGAVRTPRYCHQTSVRHLRMAECAGDRPSEMSSFLATCDDVLEGMTQQ